MTEHKRLKLKVRRMNSLSGLSGRSIGVFPQIGLLSLNVTYQYLDLVPKGRDEGDRGPFWVCRHDEYADSATLHMGCREQR